MKTKKAISTILAFISLLTWIFTWIQDLNYAEPKGYFVFALALAAIFKFLAIGYKEDFLNLEKIFWEHTTIQLLAATFLYFLNVIPPGNSTMRLFWFSLGGTIIIFLGGIYFLRHEREKLNF